MNILCLVNIVRFECYYVFFPQDGVFFFLPLSWLFKEGTCRLATGPHAVKSHHFSTVLLRIGQKALC